MKKLMTMLAAAAMAFGLYAEEVQHADTGFLAGTSFESGDNGTSGDLDSAWWVKPAAGTIEIIEGKNNLGLANRPTEYLGKTDAHVLKLATTLGNPATTKITTGATPSIEIPGNGLYFDGLVNMTVFDKDDTIPDADLDGAKLGVYLQLKGEDESDGTNFVVVAKANAKVADGHYVCSLGAAKISAGWHRLTIKAIGHIDEADTGDTGFVVFVDGKAVNCEDAKIADVSGLKLAAADWNENGNLFVSRVANNATIASVAFDGQGSVDELVFTTTAPSFAMDMNIATVAFDATKATGVQYSMDDGATWTAAVGNPFKVAAERGQALPASIKVKWTGINGYMDNPGVVVEVTAGQAATIPDSAYTQAAAAIISADGTTTNMYATLAGAVAAVNAASETGTLKLLQGAAVSVLDFEKSVTLDLNGQTVEAGQIADDLSVKASKGAEVTIVDGNPNGKVEGTLKAQGGGSKIIVTAGWYKVDPKSYLASGKKAVLDQADNYYKVTDKVAVTDVTLGTKTLELAEGASSEKLTYTVAPTGADVDSVTWASDDDTVATVADGVVTAVKAGTATITITVNDTITDTCEVTVKASEITVTLIKGAGIAAISNTTEEVTSVKGNPGVMRTVYLYADGEIALPVFKADGVVCSATFDIEIPEAASNITFTAIDAKDAETEEEATAALIDAGLDSTTVGKVKSAKALAAWWEGAGKGATVEQINESNYLKASVDLGVALIDETTPVNVDGETFAIDGSELTFTVKIAGVTITSENIENYVKVTSDVADWTKKTGIVIDVEGGVVTVDGGSNTAVFAKVVIPDDAK